MKIKIAPSKLSAAAQAKIDAINAEYQAEVDKFNAAQKVVADFLATPGAQAALAKKFSFDSPAQLTKSHIANAQYDISRILGISIVVPAKPNVAKLQTLINHLALSATDDPIDFFAGDAELDFLLANGDPGLVR